MRVDQEVAQRQEKEPTGKATSNRANKDHLTTDDIDHFKQILLQKYREITGNVNEIADGALNKANGDLSNMPLHMADMGTDNYEQEISLALMDSEQRLLREITEALERIEQQTYGTCEATSVPIPKARLEAVPWAKYCVEYARKLEEVE